MAKLHSYIPVLNKIIKNNPKEILEWGPGKSTELLANNLPDSNILTIEHNEEWFEHYKNQFFHKNINLKLVRHLKSFGGSEGYVTYPIRWILENNLPMRYFDLIFIDGRSRCDCLTVASLIIKQSGIVIIHDSERMNYKKAFKMFKEVKEEFGTAILKNPKNNHTV